MSPPRTRQPSDEEEPLAEGEDLMQHEDGDGEGDGEFEDGLDDETRARAMGWRPLAEYRGPPGRWMPARAFIEKGETELPVMRDQNRRLTEKLARVEPELQSLRSEVQKSSATTAELRSMLSEMREIAKNSDERGYQRALKEALDRQDAAAAEGNVEGVRQARAEINTLTANRVAPAAAEDPAKKVPPPAPQVPPEVTAFGRQNPWWDQDPFLSNQMIAKHNGVIKRQPGLPLTQSLAVARKLLVKEFPEMFAADDPDLYDDNDQDEGEEEVLARKPAPRAPAQQPVRRPPLPRGSGNGGHARREAQQTDKYSFESIADPAEQAQARDAYRRYKNQMPDITVREYMTLWHDPKADILTLRADAAARRKAKP